MGVIKFTSREAQRARKRRAKVRAAIERLQQDIAEQNPHVAKALEAIKDALQDDIPPPSARALIRASEVILRAVKLDVWMRLKMPKILALESENKVRKFTGQ